MSLPSRDVLLGPTPRILHGRYEVGEVIGRGGMAEVRRGHDLRSGRTVAIKMLRKDLARDAQLHQRLRREALTLAGLSHPAIVSVYDTGHHRIDDGSTDGIRVPFIVMEHIGGRSLKELLREGRPTLAVSIRHQLGLLAALDASHRAGVVHRDIKPANVMITPEGSVKVVDFGIARDGRDPTATITQFRPSLGTPVYLSPEQARGETADARSDLYSAGCLLFELVTGRPPFVGDDPVSVAYQHVHEEPARASTYRPDLPAALDRVLAKALAKDPSDRFQHARAFSDALRSATRRRGAVTQLADSGPWERCA
ncbi:protein kinase [Nocardioides sp. dk4132]|uniref:protein kinase domain-containing protein n=1 Tax=unclassified Nocardioides TaxID=2615069 RepID=UPI0012973457|nr:MULTISPECIES: protein kinase [unclassified Nocardioides]MQW76296.1 protein kinase [Nocardioides sp. dk4132]QGA07421.1 protein kinase [Nocardioides sp. dk884]